METLSCSSRSGWRPVIGCLLVRDTRFFTGEEAADPPPEFAPSVVQGKGYDLAERRWLEYFSELLRRVLSSDVDIDLAQPWRRDGPVYGDPRLAPQRLGQQAFQAVVLGAYSRRCAITGDKIRPVLQAAHIKPLPSGGEHRLDNGLLLRSDVHTLYDRGYLASTPDTDCSSVRGCVRSSGTASSSTRGSGSPSQSPSIGLTDRTDSFSNGTWTRSSRRVERRRVHARRPWP